MTTLKIIENRFESHLLTLDELIGFDRLLLNFCITHIETLNERLKSGPFEISNSSYLAENALSAIKNVRENNSLRVNYQSIFNSCLVLQVSYFTSIVSDIFNHSMNRLLVNNKKNITSEQLKKRNDINFQNMGSIIKTYNKYLNVSITKNSMVNTIAMSQLCRHVIVHSLSITDEKFISQLKELQPRDIKRNISLGEKIQFTITELRYVRFAMQQFISDLSKELNSIHGID